MKHLYYHYARKFLQKAPVFFVVSIEFLAFLKGFTIMLEYLQISNLALVESARVEMSDGFTAITGETGAGKSVMLGALGLLAGNRKGKEIIRQGADSCRVEASFRFLDFAKINLFLESVGLPLCEDGVMVLARTVDRNKAGRCFINGSPTTQAVLAKLGGLWIDFHGPGEPQKLFDTASQLDMLDAFAAIGADKDEYLELLRLRSDSIARLKKIDALASLSADEAEFLKAQLEKIDSCLCSEEELSELEADFKLSRAAAALSEASLQISGALSGEGSAEEYISRAVRTASEVSQEGGAEFQSLESRLRGAAIELADIAEEYASLAEKSASFTPERAAQIESRMSAWLEVSRKYGRTPAEVAKAREEISEKLAARSDAENLKAQISARISEAESKMLPLAKNICARRKAAASKLEASVVKMLCALGFKKPRFSVAVYPSLSEFSTQCGSSCEFMFSANAGQNPLPLAKIASSGELARVMLSIKATLASLDGTPILVFDEVDANVGGEIGASVGRELKKLSKGRQVLCVTHLPQVAACAKNHLLVEKTQSESDTMVSIRKLEHSGAERVGELARMLGDRNSPSAREHAKKLLEL